MTPIAGITSSVSLSTDKPADFRLLRTDSNSVAVAADVRYHPPGRRGRRLLHFLRFHEVFLSHSSIRNEPKPRSRGVPISSLDPLYADTKANFHILG